MQLTVELSRNVLGKGGREETARSRELGQVWHREDKEAARPEIMLKWFVIINVNQSINEM